MIWRRLAPLLALAAVAAVFVLVRPDAPISLMDIRTIFLQSSIVATAALGASMVIAMGGLDLSVGSMLALATIAAAWVMLPGGWVNLHLGGWAAAAAPLFAIIAAMASGSLCGAYNGLLITRLRLPPFIVTLGTLGFFRGFAKFVSSSSPIYSVPGWLSPLVNVEPEPKWLLIASCAWVTLFLSIACGIFMQHTLIGRRALAIGGNEEAALRCGVPIAKTKLWIYVLAGMLTGIAGVIQFARLNGSGDPTVQVGLELKAIAAVVIGGASLSGGSVSIVGTMCGAVLMSLLDNRCTALGLPNYAQEMIVGHIIIVAVAVDRWRATRATS